MSLFASSLTEVNVAPHPLLACSSRSNANFNQYKRCSLSSDCHRPKTSIIVVRVIIDNLLAANSNRQRYVLLKQLLEALRRREHTTLIWVSSAEYDGNDRTGTPACASTKSNIEM